VKLRSLEIEGFGPFKNKQTVDFSQFDGDGLFLIEGQTGSGKSSILDAITYALYGFTARWMDSKANLEFTSVRSHFSLPEEPTRAELVFELGVGDERHTYRIFRTIPGSKKDGGDRPTQTQIFEIYPDGTEHGLAAGIENVAAEVAKLIRLDKNEFLQVVLLAQGRFQAFLEATSEQRLDLLRKLFNTKRFAQIQDALAAKTSELSAKIKDSKLTLATEVNVLAQALEVDVPTAGEEVAWLESQLELAKQSVQTLTAEKDAAKIAKDKADLKLQQARSQFELVALTSEKKVIDAGRKEHDQEKSQLNLAQKASRVSGLFGALKSEESALQVAEAELEAIPKDKRAPRSLEALEPLLKTQRSLIAKLEPIVEEEDSLEELDEELEELKAELKEFVEESEHAENESTALKTERDELLKNVGDLDALRDAKQACQNKLTDFLAFENQQTELGKAKSKAATALKALTAAIERQESLTTVYKHNLASSLAAELKKGEPCLVCGSSEHPKKAKSKDLNVSNEDLNEANEARSGAASAEGSARSEFERLRKEVDALVAKFSGETKVSLEKKLTAAEEAFTKSSKAIERISAIAKQLEPDSKLQKSIVAFSNAITTKRTELKNAESAKDKIQKKVKNNAGSFDTVRENYESAISLLEILEQLQKALGNVASKKASRDKADSQFVKKRDAEGFSSTSAFDKALMTPEDLVELEEKIQEYIRESQRVETLLADAKFVGLPKEKMSVDETGEAATLAETNWSQKERDLGAAADKVAQVSNCKTRIGTLLPKIEKYSADYETHQALSEMVNGRTPNTKRISLESYFAASELEVILEAANLHLKSMSAGSQYTLKHSDKALRGSGKAGLGIEVMDEFTGRDRQPETLSGGEKFQVSLAIALGLAQVVSDRSGAIRVDTLFVDEGFGSLSSEVLDTAMRTLDSLKQGGRTIGLISHVEKMQEDIASKIKVTKTPRGPSLIHQVN
jgi:exonuclease SbcC